MSIGAVTPGAVIREAARRFGDAPAIVDPDGRVTSYRDLDRASDEAAAWLAAHDIGVNDVVALAMPSSSDYVVAYLGASKAGAVTAGINPRLADREREAVVGVLRPKLIVDSLERDPDGAVPTVGEDLDRPVCICFTSGTTGVPKGAWFTGRQLEAICRYDTGGAWGGGPPMLASTELVHVGFMTKLPWHLRMGMRIHMLGRWRASDALATIARERIPTVGGIPAQIALMLRLPDFDDHDLSGVERIVVGGGHSPPSLVRDARRRFGAPYSIRYSSTESGGVGTMTAYDAPDTEALHTVGRPRDGMAIEIRDDDGNSLPSGDVGEIWLRSPAVMSGYWNDPDATRETLVDGWLRTGDLGRLDEQGCLRLAGRSKEMFIRGGYNVYPLEVEAVLREHEAVADVAVIPRPDDVMGEVGVAVVVPADVARPPSLEALRSFADAQLARYKLPEAVRIVEELPLTPMQKLDRRRLEREERDAVNR